MISFRFMCSFELQALTMGNGSKSNGFVFPDKSSIIYFSFKLFFEPDRYCIRGVIKNEVRGLRFSAGRLQYRELSEKIRH